LQQNAPTVIEGVVIRDKMRPLFLRNILIIRDNKQLYIMRKTFREKVVFWPFSRLYVMREYFRLSDGRRLLAVICGRRRFLAASVFIYSYSSKKTNEKGGRLLC
jgi:hypothetical protein